MKQRILSAIFFVVAMLAGVFGGSTAFYGLFALITAGSLWELTGLLFPANHDHRIWRRLIGTAMGVAPFLMFGSKLFNTFSPIEQPVAFFPYLFVADLSENVNPILFVLVVLLLATFLLFVVELFLKSECPFDNIAYYLLGVTYVGVPFTLLINIAYWHGDYAPLRVFGLLLLTWTNDTMAYFIGTFIGKKPFFSRISPKKTWEGTVGGIACTFVVAYGLSKVIADFSPAEWLLLSGCVAVFGTLGDLVESMLKRSLAVKDSGAILPGHGGWLDRFDSFIFVLPFAWLALMIWEG